MKDGRKIEHEEAARAVKEKMGPKIVFISDTHTLHGSVTVPDGDVLVCCGDFMSTGQRPQEAVSFALWLDALPHEFKIVIAGNHDIMFEKAPDLARKTLGGSCIYLRDSGVEVMGVKFYGSPWQPEFCNWAFNLPRGEPLKRKWDLIPNDTDVLITHGPPKGILDGAIYNPERLGCKDLMDAVERVKPRVHAFGHIHYSYGWKVIGETTFINAAICGEDYRPTNKPIVYDWGRKEIDTGLVRVDGGSIPPASRKGK